MMVTGVFTEQQSIALTGVTYGSAKWVDYDNDGFLDLIISAESQIQLSTITRIYRNNGSNNFENKLVLCLAMSTTVQLTGAILIMTVILILL